MRARVCVRARAFWVCVSVRTCVCVCVCACVCVHVCMYTFDSICVFPSLTVSVCMYVSSGKPSRGADELSSFYWKTAVFNSKFSLFTSSRVTKRIWN